MSQALQNTLERLQFFAHQDETPTFVPPNQVAIDAMGVLLNSLERIGVALPSVFPRDGGVAMMRLELDSDSVGYTATVAISPSGSFSGQYCANRSLEHFVVSLATGDPHEALAFAVKYFPMPGEVDRARV